MPKTVKPEVGDLGLAQCRPEPLGTLPNARSTNFKGPFLFLITRGTIGGAIGKNLNGLPVIATTQVNNTSRKGSAVNLTYVLCGNSRRAIIARVGVMELALSEHYAFSSDATAIRIVTRLDFGLARPQAFVICPVLIQA